MWAVLLGVVLVLVAATSSHATVRDHARHAAPIVQVRHLQARAIHP